MRCVLLALCALAPAAAQISGAPTAIAGWNPNDPANNADGHPAILTHLGWVWNAIIAPSGLVVFAEGSRIRQIAADGTVRTRLTDSRLTNFTKLAADTAGNIYYITETEIDKLAPGGSTVKVAGNGTTLAQAGLAASDSLIFPQGLAVDGNGNLLFSDNQTDHVWRVDAGGVLRLVAGNGTQGTGGEGGPATAAQLQFPLDLGFDAAGDLLLNDDGRFLRITPDGTLVRYSPGGAQINAAVATFDSAGNVYYAGGSSEVSRMTTDGAIAVIAGNGSGGFSYGCASGANPAVGDAKTAGFLPIVGLALDTAGNILVAEQGPTSHLRQITPAGQIRALAGAPPSFSGDGGPAAAAVLDAPKGLAFDSAGALYIADSGNNRIRKITPDGTIQTIAGQGGPTGDMIYNCSGQSPNFLNQPEAVAVDSAGNVYIADTGNHRVLKLAPGGTLAPFAGTGAAGYSAAPIGTPAGAVPLNQPRAIGVDAAGAVWIGDNNERTLKIGTDGAIADVLPGLRARSFSAGQQGDFYLTSGFVAYRVTVGDQLVTVAGTGIAANLAPDGPPPVELPDPTNDEFLGSGLTRDGQGAIYNLGQGSVDLISPACHVYSLGASAGFTPVSGPWHVAASVQGDVYLSDVNAGVVWKLPHLAAAPGDAPTPALAGGAPVVNAGSMVVTSFDMTVPTGSNSTAVIRTLESDAVVPGELIRIYGQCIGPFQPAAASYDSTGHVPTTLGGVQLTIGGVAAPLISVQEGMVVAETPFGMSTSQSVPASLTFNGAPAPFSLATAAFRPGLFSYLELDGSQTALVLNQDGSVNSPTHPAPAGSIVAFFGTGLGQTNPGSVDGLSASDITVKYLAPVRVTIGGVQGVVTYAGVAPGFVGLSQINVTVPPVSQGANAVQVLVGGAPFRQAVQIWVQ